MILQTLRRIVLAGLFSAPLFSQTPSVNLPLDHFAYEWIEKLETRRIIAPRIELRNRPFARSVVVRIVREIEQKLTDDPNLITNAERALLYRLKGEFHEELQLENDPETEKHFFQYRSQSGGASYLIGDLIADQSFEGVRLNRGDDTLTDLVSLTKGMVRVRGLVRDDIAFSAEVSNTLIKGSKENFQFGQAGQGGVINYNPASKNVYSLKADAYVVFEPKWFRLQAGKDPLVLGPGRHNNLFLSDHAPPFENIRLDVIYDRIKLTYFHGWLRSDPDTVNYYGRISDRKFIAGHRLEFKVTPWLFLAGNESVIYGGRSIELTYLNPIMPIHVAEQYLGDKDNNIISFDGVAFLPGGVKTFAAVYLDDFTSARNPFTYWKQTWAVQWGVYASQPFGWANADLRFEYSRIEPYVYTHKFNLINYGHFGLGLGSFLPPNSDDYFWQITYQPLRRWRFSADYELTRHGEGDINRFGYADGFTDDDSGRQTKHFLMGVREIKNTFGGQVLWEPINQHRFYATSHITKIQNLGNVKGRDRTQLAVRIGYTLDY